MSTPRNAPCPCGSGKKYKHCCALKPSSDKPSTSSSSRHWFDRNTRILSALALALAVAIGVWKGVYPALIVLAAEVACIAIYLALRDPPPPNAPDPTLYTPEEAAKAQAQMQATYNKMLKEASQPRLRGRPRS